jgi:outer membrane protein assembly factor BamA
VITEAVVSGGIYLANFRKFASSLFAGILPSDRRRVGLGLSYIFWALILLTGCTGLKHLEDNSYLYAGYSIKLDSVHQLADPSGTLSELKSLIDHKPNRKILWMRPSLSLYNLIPEPKRDSTFQHWLKYRLGEPPVLLSGFNLKNSVAAFENRLHNRGNLKAQANAEVFYKGRTAKVRFAVTPGTPYTIKSLSYPKGTQGIAKDIQQQYAGSLLKPGDIYRLKNFEMERKRMDEALKRVGYYYFNADYLLFQADTIAGANSMDVSLTIKPETPQKALTAFRYHQIYINDDYLSNNYHPDTTKLGTIFYLSHEKKIKPGTLLNTISFETDSLYSISDHYNTLRQLMGIGIYKYANARFEPVDSMGGRLNVHLYLNPHKKISLSAELDGTFKSNNFAGPGLNLIYKNRNAFHGAELLTVTMGESFETQLKGDSKGQTSFHTLVDATLTLPRVVPFNFVKQITKSYVPKTTISAGFGIFSRVDLYRLNSFNTTFGYNWRPNAKYMHTLKPFEISYSRLANSTEAFQDYLQQNPTVRKSFEEQFILGGSYSFSNNNIFPAGSRHTLYLAESIDIAGNLAGALTSAIQGQRPDKQNPFRLMGLPFSQFARVKNELRYLYYPGKRYKLAARIIAAAALPYGNSTTIPYVRQYFVGGTNSIRAFIARALGPGTYKPVVEGDSYIDQAGDIKLETSVEYRFDLYRYMKGALFADAGNIWLVNEDPQRNGGKFNPKTFYREIAVGAGAGLRFDFNYIIVRLDLAIPLCKPYLPQGSRWAINQIDMGNPAWRKENLVWNFAIGYPF